MKPLRPLKNLFSLRSQPPNKGAALLVMLLVVLVTFSTIIVSALSRINIEAQKQKKTQDALAQAKNALIAWSVLQGDTSSVVTARPGVLPCPDRNDLGTVASGTASGSCSLTGSTTIGRFPWRTVGAEDLRDADGELLWYAVSDNFRTTTSKKPPAINSNTKGTLHLFAHDGTTLLTPEGEDLAAIIFSPGSPLAEQNRSGAPNAVSSYLESGMGINNTSSSGPFITGILKDAQGNILVNDIAIGITARELITSVEKRVLNEAQNALAAFAEANGGIYPNPAKPTGINCDKVKSDVTDGNNSCDSDPQTCIGRLPEDSLWSHMAQPWFRQNAWGRVLIYAVNKDFAQHTSGTDCSTNLNVDSYIKRYVLVAPGTALSGQTRISPPSPVLKNYLEDIVNSDAWNPDPDFFTPSTASNDQLRKLPIENK